MRNPLTMIQEAYRSPQNGAVNGSVDELRQRVIKTNAMFGLVLVGLAIVAYIILLVRDNAPLILSAGSLAIGSILSWQLANMGKLRWALVLQVLALNGVGFSVALWGGSASATGLIISAIAALYCFVLGEDKVNCPTAMVSVIAISTHLLLMARAWGDVTQTAAPLMDATILGVMIPLSFVAVALAQLRRAYYVNAKAQRRAFRHLVESVQDAVARYAADGELNYLSHTAETFFGCKRYELVGNGFVERIHVLDRPIYLKALDEARVNGTPSSVEMRMQCVRNEQYHFVWVELALSPVQETEHAEGYHDVVVILRDISERKDQEVISQKQHLAAQKASQSKSRFLATIGHELRTPLNAVVGFSEMMLDDIGGELTSAHKEYVSLIRQSGSHLLDTVNMLLDMSKIEAGKFELQTSALEPGALIEPCFAIVAGAAQAKNIKLESEKANGLPQMLADERVCRQILINLLSNAIKFSPEGATVKLRVRSKGTRVEFSVEDQGIGIAQSEIERIGEPFFQAHNGLARQYEGTGLGLSIVQGLTDLHGGEFKIKSALNEGTTIQVLLPWDGAKAPVDDVTSNIEDLSDLQFKVEAERAAIDAEQEKAAKVS